MWPADTLAVDGRLENLELAVAELRENIGRMERQLAAPRAGRLDWKETP